MTHRANVRYPAVAGMFYPAEPAVLRQMVSGMLGTAPLSFGDKPAGLIVPHAGYMYSGPTAGAAYGVLRSHHYDVVVIVAPSHREAFRGVSVYSGGAYETPLGQIAVAGPLRSKLLEASPVVRESESGHREEHALEVQLPFLQVVIGEFHLLPLVMGDQTRETCLALGEALADIARGLNVLLVASTDLSHYYPAETAEQIDRVSIDDIRSFDPGRLMDDLECQRAEACGGGPAVAVMTALRALGAVRMEISAHATSGDVTGDRRSVVGYCSAVAWKKSDA
ncbi:MAG: AmmeMemoRadiSam system protein B [Bacteroidota bacterium]